MDVTEKSKSKRPALLAGLFLMSSGAVIGYSGLFSYSGVMMIIGIGVGAVGFCAFFVGLIGLLNRR